MSVLSSLQSNAEAVADTSQEGLSSSEGNEAWLTLLNCTCDNSVNGNVGRARPICWQMH